jgi:hypothetical protein
LVVLKMQTDRERQSALALNYGVLLSTPLKNFKEDKAAEGKKQIGYRWRSLIRDAIRWIRFSWLKIRKPKMGTLNGARRKIYG